MSDLDQALLDMMDEAAEQAQRGGTFRNFGKLNVYPSRYTTFKDGAFHEITRDEFQNLPKNERQLTLAFEVGVRELNPNLEFDYVRTVDIKGREKHPDGKFRPSDWAVTVWPSWSEVTGVETMSAAVKASAGKYVETEDVPQQKPSSDGRVYNTVKFIRVFDSRDECVAAREERFGPAATATAAAEGLTVPAIWKDAVDGFKQEIAKVKAKLDGVARPLWEQKVKDVLTKGHADYIGYDLGATVDEVMAWLTTDEVPW